MEGDTNTYLYEIIQSCQNIQNFTNHLDFQAYSASLLIQSAVERQFIIIGEALNRIKQSAPTVYQQIPDADRIIGFRNIIVHGYDIVSDQLVWQIMQSHLRALRNLCQTLLDLPENSNNESQGQG
jgi:uncharacterized protein with HEPN domain